MWKHLLEHKQAAMATFPHKQKIQSSFRYLPLAFQQRQMNSIKSWSLLWRLPLVRQNLRATKQTPFRVNLPIWTLLRVQAAIWPETVIRLRLVEIRNLKSSSRCLNLTKMRQ
jgi:hypothetical protein